MKLITTLLAFGVITLQSACSVERDPAPAAAPAAPVAAAPAQPTVATPVGIAAPSTSTAAPVTPPASTTPVTTGATGAVLAIESVNGLQADGSGALPVTPGETLNLVADLFALANGCTAASCGTPQNIGVDQLTWSADDAATDVCNAAQGELCARSSRFSVSGNAVVFAVPQVLRGDITLTVRQSGTGLTAQLVLSTDGEGGRGHVVIKPVPAPTHTHNGRGH